MKNKELGILNIALVYVGTIMGAGFASGREIWQFFGVFGNKGYIGVGFVGLLFIVIGIMTSRIARKLSTNDMGKVIVPSGNKLLISMVGYFMALMLFSVLVTMSAAGGALFHQQFGGSRILGGFIIVFLVILTVIGGFDRVSRVFGLIMPILVCVIIAISVIVIFSELPVEAAVTVIKPSPLAPNWYIAALLYISYNVLAIIPIVSTASIYAKSQKQATFGVALGGLFLGFLAFLLISAMLTKPYFSQSMDLPMLGFTNYLPGIFSSVYTFVLIFAIYASATSNYYGFTTMLKNGPRKKLLIIVIAIIGFIFGLVGFTNVVAYMFPIEGFLGFGIILMLVTNYFKTHRNNKEKKMIAHGFRDFPGCDRKKYPDKIRRVTAGAGGEALLILGSDKTVLMDCGMAYCADDMICNIKKILTAENRKLDMIFLSHTHYDHIGGLPYVLKQWPEAIVYGAEYCNRVFASKGAKSKMAELGKVAWRKYKNHGNDEILIDGLRIDQTLAEFDRVCLGEESIVAIETKGHTDCSMTYVLEPDGIMFASESTGVLESSDFMHIPILKSYQDSMNALRKCKVYPIKHLVSPHFGFVPDFFIDDYWKLFIESAEEKKNYLYQLFINKLSYDEILEDYLKKYWNSAREAEQPKEAFQENAKNTIKAILKDF
ncbi:MAG: MBL fold metallo-hydrolase [Peptostreptococcaceae bacterium]|nr:MBL fold metallo-hydrolase [Peptostreptococcaceae bacterium]